MTTVDVLRELTRQGRLRVAEAERLRAQQRRITAQSDRRLYESRRLLERLRAQYAGLRPRPAGAPAGVDRADPSAQRHLVIPEGDR